MDGFSSSTMMLIIIAALTALTSGDESISVKMILSKKEANIGDDMSATCNIDTGKDSTSDITLITWVKRSPTGTEVEIGTNNFINEEFGETGRYSADLEYDEDANPGKIELTLTISNVQTLDSGEIGCKLPDKHIDVFEKFTVYAPIKDVILMSKDEQGTHHQLHSEGQEVKFNENDPWKFFCVVNGSYPQPEVEVLIGGKDITKMFDKQDKLIEEGKKPGLKKLSYETTLSNPSMIVSFNYSGKLLECKARLPGTELEPVKKGIKIQLNGYTPKFLCGKTQLTKLHDPKAEIRCTVSADKAATNFTVSWTNKIGENTTMLNGSTNSHYTFHVEKLNDTLEHEVILRIGRVFSHHFLTYRFTAENDLGVTVHDVLLQNENDASSTDGAVAVVKSCSLLSLLTLVLAAIL